MMQDWFRDARFGVFLHWGIYSLGNTSESWAFFNGEISYEDYMAQAEFFNDSAYDPEAWADLFAQAGAKYAVLTTKHHDGYALWDTQLSDLKYGKDLIGPYCDALRRRGLKVGLYFSHLDWSHPDYPTILPAGAQPHDHQNRHSNRFAYPQGEQDPVAWERFLEFHRGQLKEICTLYKPDLLWFDGDWERDSDQFRFAELKDQLQEWAPGVVVNSRMGGYGDYGTPEQGMPIEQPEGVWEFCVTINDSWGYVKKDTNHKSARQCIRMLAECAGMGGNLLLDMGPKQDGSLQPEQVAVMESIGQWVTKNGEAIFGTQAGLPAGHLYGASTLSQDRKTLYIFCFEDPKDEFAIKGIRNPIAKASILGYGDVPVRKLGGAAWAGIPGIAWVTVPKDALDAEATVIKVEFENELDLYRGHGDPITFN